MSCDPSTIGHLLRNAERTVAVTEHAVAVAQTSHSHPCNSASEVTQRSVARALFLAEQVRSLVAELPRTRPDNLDPIPGVDSPSLRARVILLETVVHRHP